MPVDSSLNSKPLKEQIKQMLDAEKNSTSKEEMFFLLSILNLLLEMVLEGRKETVLWYTISILKSRKRKNNPDSWARIVGSRNTAAIYIDCKATTALYDSGADCNWLVKNFVKKTI